MEVGDGWAFLGPSARTSGNEEETGGGLGRGAGHRVTADGGAARRNSPSLGVGDAGRGLNEGCNSALRGGMAGNSLGDGIPYRPSIVDQSDHAHDTRDCARGRQHHFHFDFGGQIAQIRAKAGAHLGVDVGAGDAGDFVILDFLAHQVDGGSVSGVWAGFFRQRFGFNFGRGISVVEECA